MRRQHVLTFIRYGVILLFTVSMLIPFFWMIISSFKDPIKVFERPINWWVDSFDFSNYTQFFTKYDGWHYIWNTVKLAAINIVGVVISNAIVAYAVAFMKNRHKKVIMALLLLTMMMPGTVTFFPQFINADAAGQAQPFFVLGLTYAAIGTIWYIILAWFAATLGSMLITTPSASRWMNRASGLIFILLGARIAMTEK